MNIHFIIIYGHYKKLKPEAIYMALLWEDLIKP